MIEAASAGVGLICLLAAVLMWSIGKRWSPPAALALVLAGSAILAGTPLGSTLRDWTGEADAVAASLAGQVTGTAISGLLGLVALGLVIHGIAKEIKQWTLLAAALLPLLMVTIPGLVGQLLINLVSFIAGGIGWLVGAPFGLTT